MTLPATVLAGVSLRGGRLLAPDLEGLEFTACTLDGVSFADNVSLRGGLFEVCHFRDTRFDAADLSGSLFVECTFEGGTTFSAAVLRGVRFRSCTFDPEVLATMPVREAKFLDCLVGGARAASPEEPPGRRARPRHCPHPRPATNRRRPI
ncbi:MAG: hypothetical protein QOF60_1101 [Actinomycetota bacterium]|nr:hypothetical protein [Actinomycetota bacterium]